MLIFPSAADGSSSRGRRRAWGLLIVLTAILGAAWASGPWLDGLVASQRDHGLSLATPLVALFQLSRLVRSWPGVGIGALVWSALALWLLVRSGVAPSVGDSVRLTRIRRTARRLHQLLLIIGGSALILITIGICCSADTGPIIAGYQFTDRVPGMGRINALLIVGLAALIGWHAQRLLQRYAQGELFTHTTATHLRWIGYLIALSGSGLHALLVRLTCSELLAEPVPVTIDLATLFAGNLIVVLSWVMQEGTLIREERDLTI